MGKKGVKSKGKERCFGGSGGRKIEDEEKDTGGESIQATL